ncbi:MAG: glycosyltransferase family 2 protein, partial [Clostridia bacterium]|nr:glycosyltransferase family 2 protein [Clostridia bacterium]
MNSENFGLISIIMAAYNAEKTIGYAIDSVLCQTYKNFELIIVNDCSEDNTESIVQSYAAKDNRIKLISNEKNLGVSLTRLEALKNCSGEWVAILDSDDAWMPEKLEKQIELQRS